MIIHSLNAATLVPFQQKESCSAKKSSLNRLNAAMDGFTKTKQALFFGNCILDWTVQWPIEESARDSLAVARFHNKIAAGPFTLPEFITAASKTYLAFASFLSCDREDKYYQRAGVFIERGLKTAGKGYKVIAWVDLLKGNNPSSSEIGALARCSMSLIAYFIGFYFCVTKYLKVSSIEPQTVSESVLQDVKKNDLLMKMIRMSLKIILWFFTASVLFLKIAVCPLLILLISTADFLLNLSQSVARALDKRPEQNLLWV